MGRKNCKYYVNRINHNPKFWEELKTLAFDYSEWGAVPDDEKAAIYYCYGVDCDFHDARGWASDAFAGEGCSLSTLGEFHSHLLRFMSESFLHTSCDYDRDSHEKISVPESFIAEIVQLRDVIYEMCQGMMSSYIEENYYDEARNDAGIDFYESHIEDQVDYQRYSDQLVCVTVH